MEGSENEKQYFERSIKMYDEMENSDDNTIKIVESSNMQIGTGSRVWECAIILGKYAIKQNLEKGLFKKKVILELGAGTGLLAIMLASLGNEVIATDIKEVVPILEKNIEGNKKVYEGKGQIRGFELDWTFDRNKIKELFIQEKIEKVDYIFASDVIYHIKHLELFSNALREVMTVLKEINKGNAPVVYLSHKARNDATDDILAEELQRKGFWGEQIDESEMDAEYISKQIDIIKLEFEN